MRFLVDINLSPRLAALLREAGHDAVDGSDLGLLTSTDERLLEVAGDDGCVVVSADSDFGTIPCRTRAVSPSVIFVRRTVAVELIR